ncbi:FkbM family methyltransferase [uncultured Sulfitobacter sp.]|uniref:FkbM family methyltransferase n=1 Tax=uncultured Sulfitobacter sp. TaxID=191468 RepID=UPI0026385547|nr:FkbM family methyltransferase [uncultured Sulfitobacter sp.]
MKKNLVGTALGHRLLEASQYLSLRRVPAANPETASMVANAILADRLITRLCPPGGTFVDVGAHIGSIFTSVHRFDDSIRILAVEADPGKARHLARRFPYCTLHAFAVGEQTGQIEFYLNPEATGYNSLIKDHARQQVAISVEIRRLDDVLQDEKPDVMKIDIEGAELGALRGGATVIAAHKPTIMFESTEPGVNAMGYSPQQVWGWFRDMGYGIYVPDRLAHDADPIGCETFLDSHAYPMRTLNYFAVHRDKRITVRDRARHILGVSVQT